MNAGISFTVCGLIFMILIILVFFLKKKVSNFDTVVYSKILLVTLLGCIIGLPCYYFCLNPQPIISALFGKLYLMFLISWMVLFTEYVLVISVNKINYEKNKANLKKTLFVFWLVLNIVMIALPIYFNNENSNVYTFGPSVTATYIFNGCAFLTWIGCLLLNIKKISSKKYLPVILIIPLGIISVIIQAIFPELRLMTFVLVFVTSIMYFTIENPDVKMIEQLNIAKDTAEKANMAKSDFLSSMSHEIRTPLNAIVNFSEAIETASSLEEAKENSKDIIDASHTLMDIVNGILDISKIESGKLEIISSPYDARETFESLGKLIRPRIEEKGIQFNVSIAEDLPPVLYGDYANVKKVVTNLLTNAAKYTDKGEISYKVECVINNNICRLIISIEDTGRGIKKQSIDKLFTKFERLDEKNTTIEGTGLGLAITKQIVELMGGEIIVQTVYGSGSKFTVAINQRIEKVDLSKIKKKEYYGKIDLTNKRILVVDDNKLNLKVASKVLGEYNPVIELVDNGFDAIEKIKNNEQYDLILMDDMMPKMSGVETLKKLKEIKSFNIPTVALTANAISGMREKYLKDGFSDYLAKPINKVELEKVLRSILEGDSEENVSSFEERFEPLPEEMFDAAKKLNEIEINYQDLNDGILEDGTVLFWKNNDSEETEAIEKNEEFFKSKSNDDENSLAEESQKNVETTVSDNIKLEDTNKESILENNGIDVKASLELLGDMDMYNETLNEFINEIGDKKVKLEEYKEMENMEDYAILVHSLKSDAKYLGMKDLAEISYDHEMKSKEKDIKYIKDNFEKLNEEMNRVVNIARKYIE